MSCFFSSEAVANLPGKNHFLKRIHKVSKKFPELLCARQNWTGDVIPIIRNIFELDRAKTSEIDDRKWQPSEHACNLGALTPEIIARIFATDY